MSQVKQRKNPDQGMTVISLIPNDPAKFYKHLLMSGIRLSQNKARVGLFRLHDGGVISATGPDCTGYLFATDGIEVSESDLFRFLSTELEEGQAVNIFGRYSPEPDKTVQSRAHFLRLDGRIMCVEERRLTSADGQVEMLRSRADIDFDNITSLDRSDRGPSFPS